MCQCLKLIVALCVISAGCLSGVNGNRLRRTSIDDQTVESVRVDINNERVLGMFNLTPEALKRIQQRVAATKSESTAIPKDSQRFSNIKEHRVGDIRSKIEMAVNGHGAISSENSDHPLHEMAAYPICGADTNESSWLDDRNVTIRFADSLFEPKTNPLYLESAILRLYKLSPNTSQTPEPTEPTVGCAVPKMDTQIRVTVSIVIRKNRREKRKRICNTLMMNVTHTGWVEIDIKRAIHIWEGVERQRNSPILVGWLLIEVHDDEERPLKPGLYFRPPNCEQADTAIPWNFYRSYSALPSSFTDQVPRVPRIDMKLIGYASLLPHNTRTRPNFNLSREIYRLTNRNPEESTTSITPTANLLDPSASTDVHRHRQRHARHHHHHTHNSASTVDSNVAGATAATSSSTRSDASVEEQTNDQSFDC